MTYSSDSSKKNRYDIFDLVIALSLGLLSISFFFFQIKVISTDSTPLSNGLFNAIQFIFTCGFGWFTNRYFNKSDFDKNIKQFAIGSYRRILDVEKMIQKLQSEINYLLNGVKSEKYYEMKLISAIVDDTAQVVRSSIFDWADVIGDELITLENIKRLEREKDNIISKSPSIYSDFDLEGSITKIEDKINNLSNSLPAKLKISSLKMREEMSVDEGVELLKKRHEEFSGLILEIISGGKYSKYIEQSTLKEKEKLKLSKVESGKLHLLDNNGIHIGIVLPIPSLPYNNLIKSIESFYGYVEIPVVFDKIIEEQTLNNLNYIHFTVRVVAEPKLK